MAQSYAQIQKKIASLQKEADALRKREVEGVVSRIKVAIEHYGLTAEQLGLGSAKSSPKAKAGKAARPAKFSDGTGNEWAGMGKRPQWLRDALAAGKSLDEFRAGPASPTAPKKNAGRVVKRRPTSVQYRDEAGHAWTGRGPQPRWLKEALASGKTLDEMKV